MPGLSLWGGASDNRHYVNPAARARIARKPPETRTGSAPPGRPRRRYAAAVCRICDENGRSCMGMRRSGPGRWRPRRPACRTAPTGLAAPEGRPVAACYAARHARPARDRPHADGRRQRPRPSRGRRARRPRRGRPARRAAGRPAPPRARPAAGVRRRGVSARAWAQRVRELEEQLRKRAPDVWARLGA